MGSRVGSGKPASAMRLIRASERGLTLYQLLVAVVALVIALSLGLAVHRGRHLKPFFADLERVETR